MEDYEAISKALQTLIWVLIKCKHQKYKPHFFFLLKIAGYLVWVLYANLDVRTTLSPSLPGLTLIIQNRKGGSYMHASN